MGSKYIKIIYLIWSFTFISSFNLLLIFSFNLQIKLVFEKFRITKKDIDAAIEVQTVEIIVPYVTPHMIPEANKKIIAIGKSITIPKIKRRENKINANIVFSKEKS